VCLLEAFEPFPEISIGSVLGERLRSVLVHDCTRGVVGAFRMKLEGYDGSDGAGEWTGVSYGNLGEGGNLGSARNGPGFEGRPGVNQGAVGEDPNGALSL
jgi:hypothetical protein